MPLFYLWFATTNPHIVGTSMTDHAAVHVLGSRLHPTFSRAERGGRAQHVPTGHHILSYQNHLSRQMNIPTRQRVEVCPTCKVFRIQRHTMIA